MVGLDPVWLIFCFFSLVCITFGSNLGLSWVGLGGLDAVTVLPPDLAYSRSWGGVCVEPELLHMPRIRLAPPNLKSNSNTNRAQLNQIMFI